MMHCTITRADNGRIHTGLNLRPTRYSANALGGPDTAEVAVTGDKNALSDVLTWLNCRVVISTLRGIRSGGAWWARRR